MLISVKLSLKGFDLLVKTPLPHHQRLSYWYTQWWLMTDPLMLRTMVPFLRYVSYSSVIFILWNMEIWKVYCVRRDVCSNGPRQRWQMVWVTGKTTTTHPSAGWKGQHPTSQNTPLQNREGQTSHFSSFFQNKIHNPDYYFTFPEGFESLFIWISVLWLYFFPPLVWVKVIKTIKLFQPS